MTNNNVNWADVIEEANSGGGGNFEPIPDGDYDLVVSEATASTTQNGKPMYTLETTVQGGPHNSRKVWDRLIVSADNGRAMGFFFRKMKSLGLPIEFFQNSPTDDQIVQALKGRTFRAKIGLGTPYNGKQSNEVKEYYPAAQGGPTFAPSAPAQGGFPPAPQQAPQGFPPAPQQGFPPAPAQAPQQQQAPAQGFPPAPAPQQGNQFGQQAPAPAPQQQVQQSPWETTTGTTPPPPTPF
jgi:hypothetical protein